MGVSSRVRTALNRDVGSRDIEFIGIIKTIRTTLVDISELPSKDYTTVLVQGSGTFAVESVLNSTSDRDKSILILASGAYGKRMKLICDKAGIESTMLLFSENEPMPLEQVREVLKTQGGSFGAVAVVHCETTSGILNPISEIGRIVKETDDKLLFIVDAMSSFGGVVADFTGVDFLISSANKCIQGVPGFAFVIARIDKLVECQGKATSLSLDLYDQWKGLEGNGQFRFTPPTHCLLGFMEALNELATEGGIPARAKRYQENNRIIKEGMKKLGFRTFVDDANDGHIITSFYYPNNENFQFEEFYDRLSDKGQLIYPGKVTKADCFRIGNIGHLFPADMYHLLDCIELVLKAMHISVPVS
ncbi:unnamed protein product [Allacma fusca]|uniref:Alanine--glyoxylate aminotransferase n=1 Tax=Allacma fusca TaxID=39272 RepID=A0A8J2KBW3_9HEXA|nr:unnamed protein product [Allacma fusca]